jgi:type III secretion protein N (ATPase)
MAALEKVIGQIAHTELIQRVGRVVEAYGTLIKVTGIRARLGDLCELEDEHNRPVLKAEVIGIRDEQTWLAPLGPLEGLSVGMKVRASPNRSDIALDERILGRVLDAFLEPLDDKPSHPWRDRVPLYRQAPNPLQRLPVDNLLVTGVKTIDALMPVGLGQRVGIFAVAGGGKSTLLGMLARGAEADINVIVLVGERGREVREFIEESLGEAGLKKTVVIVATSDRPALERARAAYAGTAIAEYFRDKGLRVLLMMDSVTRYARALRDIGLALGEPPARRGYTPSVFAQLPRLFERVGNNRHGYITAFYTVLIEDEQEGDDPLAEEVRSLLDGHICLSRKIAAEGQYPAIDVLSSASRLFNRIASAEHLKAARYFISLLAKYREIELLLRVGEYKKGNDPLADAALEKIAAIRDFLKQSAETRADFAAAQQQLRGFLP